MQQPAPNDKKPFRIIICVIAGVTAAVLVVLAVLGGYTPFYREFLQDPKKPHFAEHVSGVNGIEYVARINPGMYRGADPRERLDQLAGLGVRSIINFRYLKSHDYREEAERAGFRYFWMPIYPGEPPSDEEIDRFLQITADPDNQPVYIHCTLGIDRTGLMSGIYRIERDGWTNEQAVEEMEYFGHNELWIDLEDYLKAYRPRAAAPGK